MKRGAVEPNALSQAIEGLYETFSRYPLKAHVDGCPHCTTDEDHARIHKRTLRELSGDDLGRYAFKALTTWGGNDDFRHFLPRLFELVVRDPKFYVNTEIVIGKLDCGGWSKWPTDEREAIQNYLYTVWTAILESTTFTIDVETWLACLVSAFDTAKPALEMWSKNSTPMATGRLIEFVRHSFPTLSKNRKIGNAFIDANSCAHAEVLAWLTSPEVVQRLEKCFLEEKDESLSEKLSTAVEQVYWLQERETAG